MVHAQPFCVWIVRSRESSRAAQLYFLGLWLGVLAILLIPELLAFEGHVVRMLELLARQKSFE